MIEKLSIENFKSIRKLDLACKKINIFIGEPNAGKSNIVEAIGIFSDGNTHYLKDLIRFKSFAEVFYNKEVSQNITINADQYAAKISFGNHEYNCVLTNGIPGTILNIKINTHDQGISASWNDPFNSPFRFYQYKSLSYFGIKKPGYLLAPSGENLITSLTTNEKPRDLIGEIYKSKGLRLLLDEERNEVSLIKDSGNISSRYSFEATSETLRRITFLILALETNHDCVLVFDEPEANLFPFYTTYFAERLAKDESNQYFFTTHNSYLINTLVAKLGMENLNICLTYMEDDYQTKIKVLSGEEINEFVNSDLDITLNFSYFLEK